MVAINQADMAMKGRHWDDKCSAPDDVLEKFLEDKAVSVMKRIKEATGVKICKPVYFSAESGYHVRELLDMVIDNMPKERRKLFA